MRARLQFILAIYHDLFAGFQPFIHQREISFRLSDFDRSHLHGFIWFDQISVRSLRAALHDARGNHRCILSGGQDQAGIDEFSRPKFQIIIRERRLQLYSAGRWINFVVDDSKRAFIECVCISAVERQNFQPAVCGRCRLISTAAGVEKGS